MPLGTKEVRFDLVGVATLANPRGHLMYKDAILEELERVERDVVEAERQLAEQEALLVALERQNEDTSKARTVLDMMREAQEHRQAERQRLLSLLQP
jgi:hypothetical protein